MAILDTLTTRDAIRHATLDDIIGRCQAAAVAIEGGPLDGVDVVSMGVLRDQVTASLMVKLPPPSERHAEVSTPANVTVSAVCPECKLPVTILVVLSPTLTVDNGGPDGADWPTLDALASRLELVSEGDRGDLEESLYSYAHLAEPLVEIRSAKGEPVRYVLTNAGEELVDAAADDEDEDGDEPNGEPVLA